METVIIAEKAELADAIAGYFGVTSKERGVIHCGKHTILYSSGHILELCDPEDYNPEHTKWNLDHLPIVNVPWRYKVIKGKEAQYKKICDYLNKASSIIHAGDPDSEGQLLVDEILHHQKINKPVQRVLINDLNPRIVERSFSQLKDNRDFIGLSNAALSRSVGDQLYGYNLTRLYTLLAQKKGYTGTLSVGRVQTPILGLIVARDRLIEGHEKHFYYVIKGEFSIDGITFTGTYQVKENDPKDEKGRLDSKDAATAISEASSGKPARVTSAETKEKREHPPLPYDLLGLQSDAYRKFGLNSKKTLEITQRLREKKLITYNRTDCRYLSEEQHQDAPIVLKTIEDNCPMLGKAAAAADPTIKSKAFNSSKVTAHHGIVPAEGRYAVDTLPNDEKQIYLLIARQYIAQFWPVKVSEVTTVTTQIDNTEHEFKATSTTVISLGWGRLYTNDTDNDEINDTGEEASNNDLRSIARSQTGQCVSAVVHDKETKPPKHYTEATLLKDLRRVAKYVTDPKIAALLLDKDKDSKEEQGGIGTPATRHTFIETLKDRGYITEKKGYLISTELGREFHDVLPSMATGPDMTALWYEQQKQIEQQQMTIDDFIQSLVNQVSSHIEDMKANGLALKANTGPSCPKCEPGHLCRRKGAKGFFWGCTEYPACDATYPDKAGKPNLTPAKSGKETEFKCGECGSALVKRPAKKRGKFWFGCSGYPGCKSTYLEKAGKPVYKQH
ncbi:DNA topoisomerase 3 [Gilvimarinus chinensis]|uniref:DNA topoisomerase 3 n=1 Tax=Gilvimarinus chinensis TaxID=396005 RepID=UPI000368D83B|nr:DNA topoisomerase 3 [Gilvimarinus chinensis]